MSSQPVHSVDGAKVTKPAAASDTLRGGATGTLFDRRDVAFCLVVTLLAFAAFIACEAGTRSFLYNLVTFDGHFYLDIAKHGYAFSGDILAKQNVSFLPLEAGAIALVRLLLPGHNDFLKIALLGALALFGILLGFFALLQARYGKQAARLTSLLWVLGPVSFYHFVGYTEPLFALATVWCLVALHRRWMWTATVVAGLAMIGRPQAIVLVAFVVVELLRQAQWRPWRLFNLVAMGKLVALALPLLAYATWMALRFGDSALYANSMAAWRLGSLVEDFLPVWSAIPYFLHAVSDASPVLTLWSTLLGGMTLLMVVLTLAFMPAAPARVAWMYVAFLVFLAATTSFDVKNLARHVFFLAPWAIVLGLAVDRMPGRAWKKYAAITPLLVIFALLNVVAISRFYHALWVS